MVHIDIQNSYLRDITSHANDKLTGPSTERRDYRSATRGPVKRFVRQSPIRSLQLLFSLRGPQSWNYMHVLHGH